jgi:Fungal Zn(2)-Cys(6) binuclear cluster domain
MTLDLLNLSRNTFKSTFCDVFQTHFKRIHTYMDSEKRKRTSKACDYCHKKRIKCLPGEDESACQRCVLKGIKCTFDKPVNKRGPPAGSKKTKHVNSLAIKPASKVTNFPHSTNTRLNNPILDLSAKLEIPKIKLQSPVIVGPYPPFIIKSGAAIPWLDMYFTYVHPKYPCLPTNWVIENHHLLPAFLLNSMYALTTVESINNNSIKTENGVEYFEIAKKLYEKAIKNPSPFDVAAIFFMGVACLRSKTDYATGISWIQEAIDLSKLLGILNLAEVSWTMPDGKKYLLQDQYYSKQFCQLLMLSIYSSDFEVSFIQKAPFHLEIELPQSFYQPIHGGLPYSPYYTSYMWCWESQLIYISRKVALYIYNLPGRELETATSHLNALDSWMKSLPAWMNDFSSGLQSLDNLNKFPPPAETYYFWKAAYLHILYHSTRLLLLKEYFIDAVESNRPADPIIAICNGSATKISALIEMFLKHNSNFVGMPHLSFYWIFLSAAFHCLSIRLEGITEDIHRDIDNSIVALRNFVKFSPSVSQRIQILQEWREDPVAASNDFRILV